MWSSRVLVAGALAASWCGIARAEVVTMRETGLTLIVPEGWHHAGTAATRFHPDVRVDVLTAQGAEAHVFLSDAACPPPSGAAWKETSSTFLSDEIDVVWQSQLRDVEQGCYATRRGELVIIVAAADPATWDSTSSQRLSDALIEAANGPNVSAAVAEARLRVHDTGSAAPLALSLVAQVSRVGDPVQYHNASALYDANARLGVFARPVAVRVEGKFGRASTGAARLDAELGIGPAFMRDDLIASFTIGAAIGGQTASDRDTSELPEDPIPVLLRIPLVAEAGERLGTYAAASARVRVAWLTKADSHRTGGSPTLGTDEFSIGARLSIGRAHRPSFVLGLALDEELGTRMFVVSAGIGTVPF